MARSISGGAKARGYVVPGLWQHEHDRLLDEAQGDDPRLRHDFAPGLTDGERQAASVGQHSGPSYARQKLAVMDAQGWISMSRPSAHRFPTTAAVQWLADRSVRHVRVDADDFIEPAPQ